MKKISTIYLRVKSEILEAIKKEAEKETRTINNWCTIKLVEALKRIKENKG